MANKRVYSEDEAKTLSLELQKELDKLSKALDKLENNIDLLQIGDRNGSYWAGDNAKEFYKASLGHVDHDRNLIKKLEKCSEQLETAIK